MSIVISSSYIDRAFPAHAKRIFRTWLRGDPTLTVLDDGTVEGHVLFCVANLGTDSELLVELASHHEGIVAPTERYTCASVLFEDVMTQWRFVIASSYHK